MYIYFSSTVQIYKRKTIEMSIYIYRQTDIQTDRQTDRFIGLLPMKGNPLLTRRLLYHNDYYVKHIRFKTKKANAVMLQPMNTINGVNDGQEKK